MIEQTLAEAAVKIGFTADKNCACGVYDKYLVSIYSESGNKVMYINYLIANEEDSDLVNVNVGNLIKEYNDAYSIIKYEYNDGGLTVETDCTTAKFFELLDKFIEALSQYELFGCDHCTSCGCEFGDRPAKKIRKGSKNFITCESCALEAIENHGKQNTAVEPPTKSQKSKAVIFSLLGGLIGAILYFVMYAFVLPLFGADSEFDVRYIFCVLGFAVSALVYYGFTIFVKKDSKSTYSLIGIITLVFTLAGQYIGYVFFIMNKLSVSFPPAGVVYLMPFRSNAVEVANNYSTQFYILTAVSLLFAVCGCVIFLIGLYEHNHQPKEEMTVETVTKIG